MSKDVFEGCVDGCIPVQQTNLSDMSSPNTLAVPSVEVSSNATALHAPSCLPAVWCTTCHHGGDYDEDELLLLQHTL